MTHIEEVSPDEAAAIYDDVRRERRWLFDSRYHVPSVYEVVSCELRRRRVVALLEEWRGRRRVRPGENPLLEAIEVLSDGHADGGTFSDWGGFMWADTLTDARGLRHKLAMVFSWAVPNEAALDLIAARSPVVEVGAGSGYWAALIRSRGAEVEATDVKPGRNHWVKRLWSPVGKLSAVDAAEWAGTKTLLLVWPPHGDDSASADALVAYRGDRVVYVGEQDYGCTGSDAFHALLDQEWDLCEEVSIPQWPGIHDTVCEYRRKT